MQNKIYFGTAGIPSNSKGKSSEYGILSVRENNLDAMEIEFVRGVKMGMESAGKLRKKALKNNVILSCHCPYYINLNSEENEKIEASIRRITDSAERLNAAGGKNVVFHAGFYLNDEYEKALSDTLENLSKVREFLDENNMSHIILRPELTGKPTQIGSEYDLIYLCRKLKNTLPCIDFSHFIARYNMKKDIEELFKILEKEIPEFFNNAHCHLSGIDFGEKGEKNHLDLEESRVDYKRIIDLMIEYNMNGTVICESPSLESDALKMKRYYEEAVAGEK